MMIELLERNYFKRNYCCSANIAQFTATNPQFRLQKDIWQRFASIMDPRGEDPDAMI